MLQSRATILFILAFFILGTPCPAKAGYSIFVVQSLDAKPYEQTFNGFKATLGPDVDITRIILSDSSTGDTESSINKNSPDLVISIGDNALSQVKHIEHTPIVHVMALDVDQYSGQSNITGIGMRVDPERKLDILLKALPQIRTIGLLYDPEESGDLVNKIRLTAAEKGITLIANEVFRPENVPPSLVILKNHVDLFWMLPDLTVVTPETIEFLIMLSMESGTPIFSFAEKYVEQGALLSINFDPTDIGSQAAEMSQKILTGKKPSSIPVENPRKMAVSINLKIAEKLDIKINEEILNHATRIIK